MDVGDWLAPYAAALSSAVAFIQFQQHRAAARILKIRSSQEFRSEDGHVSLMITNLSSREMEFEFVGVGAGYRSWLMPWRLKVEEAYSLDVFVLDGHEDISWNRPLAPGQLVYASWRGTRPLPRAERNMDVKGFSHSLCILITHSLSDRDYVTRQA